MSYDPGQYPPAPPPGQPGYPPPVMAYGPPPAPKKGLSTGAIVGIVIGAVLLVCCGGGLVFFAIGAKGVKDAQASAAKDVKIADCRLSDLRTAEALVEVRNSGRDTATYTVTVAFLTADGDRQIDTAMAIVNDLAPGLTAQEKATSLKIGSDPVPFRCRIADVRRL